MLLVSPWRAAGIGALATLLIPLGLLLSGTGIHLVTDLSLRALHVLAAGVWVGLIVFVNFVQLKAIAATNAEERGTLVRHVVPGVSRAFTGAAHATLATGVMLAVPIGSSLQHRPVLLAAVVGGLAMWAIVQFVLRPNIGRVTGRVGATAAELAQARTTIAIWARVNLVLSLPVMVGMVIGAHAGL